MKTIIIGIALFFCTTVHALDLEYIRKNYSKAVNDESICKNFIDKLNNKTESYVHLAYLGAFQTIWANHVFNPASKMKTFYKGVFSIETAVKNDSENIEIRFIRYSIQKNCPAFLGYRSNLASDKKFLKDNLGKITSEQLKKMVKALIE